MTVVLIVVTAVAVFVAGTTWRRLLKVEDELAVKTVHCHELVRRNELLNDSFHRPIGRLKVEHSIGRLFLVSESPYRTVRQWHYDPSDADTADYIRSCADELIDKFDELDKVATRVY